MNKSQFLSEQESNDSNEFIDFEEECRKIEKKECKKQKSYFFYISRILCQFFVRLVLIFYILQYLIKI